MYCPDDDLKEKWITVELGDGTRRRMPQDKLSKAEQTSKWLVETAIQAGYTCEEAESLYSIVKTEKDG